jgi:hypothetical protein
MTGRCKVVSHQVHIDVLDDSWFRVASAIALVRNFDNPSSSLSVRIALLYKLPRRKTQDFAGASTDGLDDVRRRVVERCFRAPDEVRCHGGTATAFAIEGWLEEKLAGGCRVEGVCRDFGDSYYVTADCGEQYDAVIVRTCHPLKKIFFWGWAEWKGKDESDLCAKGNFGQLHEAREQIYIIVVILYANAPLYVEYNVVIKSRFQ